MVVFLRGIRFNRIQTLIHLRVCPPDRKAHVETHNVAAAQTFSEDLSAQLSDLRSQLQAFGTRQMAAFASLTETVQQFMAEKREVKRRAAMRCSGVSAVLCTFPAV